MASPADFRRIALSFPGAEEKGHMGHPDFRVAGKVFATLGRPDTGWGMVALMSEQQADFMALAPDAFRPANGAWGRNGSTLVRLDAVSDEALENALAAAGAAWPSPGKRPMKRVHLPERRRAWPESRSSSAP